MIECIFTIDYEIYGNGQGSLMELVFEPAEHLKAIFQRWSLPFVLFVEVAELEAIEAEGTDPAVNWVKDQIRHFYKNGFELGLHLHPQWYKALYKNGKWLLNYSEYNLCKLPRERIIQIVERSIAYLKKVVGVADFTPFSFRAGNWLFQPSHHAATVLAERGIRVDSSVFKGGLQHRHKLDYRPALRNGYYWRFTESANMPDAKGVLLELPIYTQMVPALTMLTAKRVNMQRKGPVTAQTVKEKVSRIIDFMRFRHPLKFDFCRMSIDELTRMVDIVIREDKKNPELFRPIVAIGHTKDLTDLKTVESFLSYLTDKDVKLSTFKNAYQKCMLQV